MSCSKEFPTKGTKLEVSVFESVDGKKVVASMTIPLAVLMENTSNKASK